MSWLPWIPIVMGLYPLWRAWEANRLSSLRDALLWAALAWLSWGVPLGQDGPEASLFISLSLTGCAGIAVLGARRPHVFAWNFVILGLLSVLLLPLLENLVIGAQSLDSLRLFFLAATLLLGTINYLPTRFGAAAALLGISTLTWMATLLMRRSAEFSTTIILAQFSIVAVPWLAWLAPNRKRANLVDDEWLIFRDRFGLVWGQRLREQFNRAAENAGLPVHLSWSGLTVAADAPDAFVPESLRLLQSLTKRFAPLNESSGSDTP